ncbi:dehydrogenase [Amycolatopsis antarctica]|uniref:Dehydrogenase n=1 Tax=Amycolatopsis antarctica TaxID=1854586 RepID=A0A263D4I8_9PSEU|nr:isocitrate/isopropylmalate family dehydrogenase [Amycolatopsis antarctica]OZM73281.1 dehydrogenase [Amycolatopsis antarctica]
MTTIAVIPGDGIGPEVVEQAMVVLDRLGIGLKFDVLDHVNATSYLRDGSTLETADMDRVRSGAGILLGAIGDPRVRSVDYAREILLRLRFELDLYVNYRPARLLHDRLSPLRDPARRAIDCVLVRENTEGLYVDVGGTVREGTDHETAIDAEVSTYFGVSRVIGFALRAARHGVCMVDKANAVRNSGELWQRCWRDLGEAHPELVKTHLYVDVAAMRLVEDPASFEVIVTNNSYGDILSDLAAQVAGGLGAAASANINPESGAGLYEPVHGSAPDIAGTGTANPFGAILSGAMLLDQLGRTDEANAVRGAVDRAVAARRCTVDLGGQLGTADAGRAVVSEL